MPQIFPGGNQQKRHINYIKNELRNNWRIVATKTTILYLNEFSQMGGAEHSLLLILKNINPEYYSPVLVTETSGELTQKLSNTSVNVILQKFCTMSSRGLPKIIKSIVGLFKDIIILKKLADDYDDVIFHSNTLRMHVLASITGFLFKIPAVVHLRWVPVDNDKLRTVLAYFFKCFKPYIIFVSNSVVQEYKLEKYSRKRVIYNAVTFPEIKNSLKNDLRKKHGLKREDKIFLIMGRLDRWKGQNYIIDAFKEMKKTRDNIYLFIVGDDIFNASSKYKEEIMAMINSNELKKHIIFTGHVNNPLEYIAISDIVYHSSVSPEPFGRVIAEAMALSKPVIASNIGGPLEIIKHGETGFLCNIKDLNEVNSLTNNLLNSETLYKTIASNAREWALQNYTVERYVNNITEVYKKNV